MLFYPSTLMNSSKILFLFLIFSLFLLSKTDFTKVILDLNQIAINGTISDSAISKSNNTLYVLNSSQIMIFNISIIDQIEKTSISNVTFDKNKTILINVCDDKNMILLTKSWNSLNHYLHFFDITNEIFPKLIKSSQFIITSGKITQMVVSTNITRVFLMIKNRSLLIFDILDNKSFIKVSEKLTPNSLRFSLTNDENFVFYHTNITVDILNITNISKIIESKLNVSANIPVSVMNYFVNSGGVPFRYTQMALSLNKHNLYVFQCPIYYNSSVYAYNIRNMSNITFSYYKWLGNCDVPRDEIFAFIPSENNETQYAFKSDPLGISLFFANFNYQSFHTRTKIWCIKFHFLPNHYLIALDTVHCKMRVWKLYDIDNDNVPTAFVYNLNDIPDFPATTPITYLRVGFVIYLNYYEFVLVVHGGYGTIWDFTNRNQPRFICELNNTIIINSQVYNMVDAHAYSSPNCEYFLFYTRINYNLVYTLDIRYKNYTNWFALKARVVIQNYATDGYRGVLITQLGYIAYIIPFCTEDFCDLINIAAVDISAKNPTLNYTDIVVGTNNRAGIATCQKTENFDNKTHKYLFYKIENKPFLYIYEINPVNYTNLTKISSILVTSSINEIKNSSDCNILYMGGDSFVIVNVTNKYAPNIIKIINIDTIYEIQIVKNRFIYIMTASNTQKLDIRDPNNPIILLNAVFPYNYNPSSINYKTAIISESNGQNTYLYRSFWDSYDVYNNHHLWKAPICLLKESRSSYYLILLNPNDTAYIGKRITYKFYVIDVTQQSYFVQGKVNSVQLGNVFNSIDFTPIPSWITFDFQLNEIYITPDKSYLNKSIVVIFTFTGFSSTDAYNDSFRKDNTTNIIRNFYQSVIFPVVKSSLNNNVIIDDQNKKNIQINSPSLQTITIVFSLEINQNNKNFIFIADSFAGVFITDSFIESKLTASGYLTPINDMLKKLRYNYTFDNTSLINFVLTIDDQINQPISQIFPIEFLNPNKKPQIFKNLQEQIQTFLNDDGNFTTSKAIKFSISANSFIDPDIGDILKYTIYNLPNWMTYDSMDFMLYGVPSINDEGNYTVLIEANDGYAGINDSFSFGVYDNPPYIDKLMDQVAFVGRYNLFTLTDHFKDDDGPVLLSELEYTYSVIVNQSLIEINKYWLEFSSYNFEFYGTPSVEDFKKDNNPIIMLIASDSVKKGSTSFRIVIKNSLILNENYPIITSATANNVVTILLSSITSKLLIPSVFVIKNSLSLESSENMTQIKIVGNTENLNDMIKILIYRPIENTTHRRNLENFYEELTFQVSDDIGQTFDSKYNISIFPKDNNYTVIDERFAQNKEITIEIGNSFQISLDKALFSQKNPNIQLNYSMIMKGKDGAPKDFLQFSTENFLIYSRQSIDSTLHGSYIIYLIASDEFGDECIYNINLKVDYSFADKVIEGAKLFGTLIGPIMSILAAINYYYVIYNYIAKNSININDKIIEINKEFKWNFPMIGDEYKISLSIKSKFIKIAKKKKSMIFKNFFDDNKNQPKGLNFYQDFHTILKEIPQYKSLPENIVSTVECIVEGLLIENIIKKLPLYNIIFKKILNEIQYQLTKHHKKHRTNHISQWYNYFFIHSSDKQNSYVPISNYCLQTGNFYFLEKHCFIDINSFEEFYLKVISKMNIKEKNIKKGDQWSPSNYKFIIMHALILSKRGILKEHTSNWLANTLNYLFSILGLRIFSYRSGDVFLANVQNVNDIHCLLKPYKNKRYARPQAQFFSLSNKTVPNWMIIEQKRGVLTIKGEAPTFEKNKVYLITILDKKKMKMCEFSVVIQNGNQIAKKKVKTSGQIQTINTTNYSFVSPPTICTESALLKVSQLESATLKKNYNDFLKTEPQNNVSQMKENPIQLETSFGKDRIISVNYDTNNNNDDIDENKGQIKYIEKTD